VKDEREKDRNHIIETTFDVPLDFELADEILPAMARDLFQENGGEYSPKPEMQTAEFNLSPGMQLMTVKTHPDLAPIFKIQGVNLRRIKCKKTEGGTWMLQVTASWQMGAAKEATAMIQALKEVVYLTFEKQQENLLDDADAPAGGGKDVKVGKGGNVESITDAKKKKRKARRSPEEEGMAQEEAGAAAAASEVADPAAGAADDVTKH